MSKPKVITKRVKKKGAPAYLVSFGDMMTLILCFFILLVAMSRERDAGLVARGLGSFVVTLRSHGVSGVLDAGQQREVFNEMRRRFNLPPEEDPERRAPHEEAALQEVVTAEVIESMKPRHQVRQPRVATFDTDSSTLTASSRAYLDSLVDSLRPASRQLLVLEGHARDAGPAHRGDDAYLALRRADAVRTHLIEQHGLDPSLIESRAWFGELPATSKSLRGVDARLVTPPR